MRSVLLAAAAAISVGGPVLASGPDALVGVWLTDNADSKIRIAPCGRAFCGTITWAKINDADVNNPDPALRRRSMIGLPLTKDMHPDGPNRWAGSIYNPQDGKTYSITMRVKGRDKLEVEGCVLGVLCGSDTWSRDGEETASAAPLR